jgi:hypothetical protein
MKATKDHPLILVCYMDREVMNNRELMAKISENMNSVIAERGANMMAFFVPTDDKERIECINPIHTTENQNDEINKMIGDIKKSFDIGQGADDNLDEGYE